MSTKANRERGVAMALAAIWLTAIIAIAAIAVEVSRLTDTATEVQVAADAATLAAAQNMINTNDQTAATSAAQTIAALNNTDARTPSISLEFGSYSVALGFLTAPPIPLISVPAVRGTATITNVRYLLATVFGAGASTTVTKRAVAKYACTGQAQPTAPFTICDCALQQYTQGQPCSGTGGNPPLTQTPDGSQNSCLLASNSNDGPWLSSCPGVGQGSGSPPIFSVGGPLPLSNGQTPPVLRDIASCVNAGVHNFVIPIIHCSNQGGSCSIGNCNQTGTVVGFASIYIASSRDVDTSGGNKSITFTQVCDTQAPGTPGPGTAICFGQGNATLVDDRG